MGMKETDIDELLIHILENRGTSEEITRFAAWYREDEAHRAYFEQFKRAWNLTAGAHALAKEVERGLRHYDDYMEDARVRRGRWRRLAWAVSTAAAVMAGIFIYTSYNQPVKFQPRPYISMEDRQTGVILTLADGREVNMSRQDSFRMAADPGALVTINKTGNRTIAYSIDSAEMEEEDFELTYNQVVVPAGKRFSIQLSDGTRVWINSESSLRYPTRFGADLREVEVQGNVYFEVAKDSTRPFIVTTPTLRAEVLGTSFEVNTYGDGDNVSATLVTGSLRVHTPVQSTVIKPNQQLRYNTRQQQAELLFVDAARIVKWKDGILTINHEPFDDVLWKLERWYGVKIENRTGETFTQLFSGEFDEEDIHGAMDVLCSNLDIHYDIEEERIVLKR